MNYKINYLNPLNYILLILGIPYSLIVLWFTEETLIDVYNDNKGYFKGEPYSNPRDFLIKSRMVTKLKSQETK